MKLLAGATSKIISALAVIVIVVSIVATGLSFADVFRDSTAETPYFVSQSNSVLQVQTDGSLRASEQRTYQVKDNLGHIVWNMGITAEKNTLKMDAVRLSILDEAGNVSETHTLDKAAYDPEWENGGNELAMAAYGIETGSSQLHIFTGKYDAKSTGSLLVSLDYTVEQAVVPYRDVTELKWALVSGLNNAATKDASLSITLPSPGTDSAASESIYAWSHGPESGRLSVLDDGVVSYAVDMVDVWQFVNLTVEFPTAWLTSVPKELAEPYANELHLEYAKKDEKDWVDTWHGRTANSYLYDMVVMSLFIVVALFSLFIYMRCGKSRKPDFTDVYSGCDPAGGSVHPSVIGRIWRWNRKSVDDLRAAIVHLVSIGAVTVSNEADASAAGVETSAVAGYRLAKVDSAASQLDDPIDKQTLHLLFTVVANKAKDVRVQEVRAFKRDHADKYQAAVDEWQSVLDLQMEGDTYIEQKSKRWQVRLIGLAVITASVGLALFLLFGHPTVIATALASAVVVMLMANYVPRRSPEGNNIAARSKALRNWLRDDYQLSGITPDQAGVSPLYALMPYASITQTTKECLAKAQDWCDHLDECAVDKLDEEDVHWRICYVASELRKEAE